MSRVCARALRSTVAEGARALRSRAACVASIRTQPKIAVSGVRSSCDSVIRNSSFRRLALRHRAARAARARAPPRVARWLRAAGRLVVLLPPQLVLDLRPRRHLPEQHEHDDGERDRQDAERDHRRTQLRVPLRQDFRTAQRHATTTGGGASSVSVGLWPPRRALERSATAPAPAARAPPAAAGRLRRTVRRIPASRARGNHDAGRVEDRDDAGCPMSRVRKNLRNESGSKVVTTTPSNRPAAVAQRTADRQDVAALVRVTSNGVSIASSSGPGRTGAEDVLVGRD